MRRPRRRLTQVHGTPSRASPIATLDSAPPRPSGSVDPLPRRPDAGASSSAIVSPSVTTDPDGVTGVLTVAEPQHDLAAAAGPVGGHGQRLRGPVEVEPVGDQRGHVQPVAHGAAGRR